MARSLALVGGSGWLAELCKEDKALELWDVLGAMGQHLLICLSLSL